MRHSGNAARLLMFALSLCVVATGSFAEQAGRLQQSRALTGELHRTLGARLKSAMQQGGPVAAVEACRLDAQPVTRAVSDNAPARVSRTALRIRNPDNQPTREQALVLEGFEKLLAGGKTSTAEHFQVRKDGSALYMKAIPTGSLCLTCHGSTLAEPVAEASAKNYPADRATGFEIGELRGAFVVEWPATGINPP